MVNYVGEKIRSRRKFLKIDQATLAELAGVGINTVVAIERGVGNPKLETVMALLDTLGMQMVITLKD